MINLPIQTITNLITSPPRLKRLIKYTITDTLHLFANYFSKSIIIHFTG